MAFMRTSAVLLVITMAGSLGAAQQQPAAAPEYSPLGYYDLQSYAQAFPGVVGSAEVRAALAQRFWAFRGVAYRTATVPE